jgi:PIN domain nuclease of toxin-antitoxin system
VRLLLDTHVWLWLLENPDRIARPALEEIKNASELILSAASVWEFSIKANLGKLTTTLTAKELRNEILHQILARELAITGDHAMAAAGLPPVHRDPFDRMLIAQSQLEELALVSSDTQMRNYGDRIIWAGK